MSDCLVGQKESARHESLLMLKTNTLTQPNLKMSSNLINRGKGIRYRIEGKYHDIISTNKI